jgi:hypothetical protein
MNILLRGKGCNRSAITLGQELGLTVRRQPQAEDKVIVRWGSTRTAVEGEQGTVNSRDAIYKASQKISALEFLGENDITVPRIWQELSDAICLPCLSRQQVHRQGRDICLINTIEEAESALADGKFLVELLPVREEYRAHVVNFEPIKLFRKVKIDDTADELIRSARLNWRFYNIDISKSRWLNPLLDKAVSVAKLLGLFFTAVDIIHTTDHRFVVLEANSAPGLADNAVVRTIYVEAIKKWMEENYEVERICRAG